MLVSCGSIGSNARRPDASAPPVAPATPAAVPAAAEGTSVLFSAPGNVSSCMEKRTDRGRGCEKSIINRPEGGAKVAEFAGEGRSASVNWRTYFSVVGENGPAIPAGQLEPRMGRQSYCH